MATGGLGPTADDLTRDALAAVAGRELVLDEPSLEYIRGLFARFKRDMPESNRVQAMFPAGSRIIPNPNGTAPGIWMDVPRPSGGTCHIFALPGVPAEMFEMFNADRRAGRHRAMRRAACDPPSPHQVLWRRRKPRRADAARPDSPRPPAVGRHHRSRGHDHAAHHGRRPPRPRNACAAMEPTVATIRECLGSLVFGEEDDELEDAVVRLLARPARRWPRSKSAPPARWPSGSAAPVAGENHYLGGQVIHSPAMLVQALGPALDLVEQHGPASREVAEALAVRCRERTRRRLCAGRGSVSGRMPAQGEHGHVSLSKSDPPFHFAWPRRTR